MPAPWCLIRARVAEAWHVTPWTVDDPDLADEVGLQLEMWDIEAKYNKTLTAE